MIAVSYKRDRLIAQSVGILLLSLGGLWLGLQDNFGLSWRLLGWLLAVALPFVSVALARKAIDNAMMQAAARGFQRPPGSMFIDIGRALQDERVALSGASREIAIKQAERDDRIVAIKFSQAKFSERFEREARAVAALNHPNICTLYDVGPNYLVMEYVDGVNLRQAMRAGRFTPEQALAIVPGICDALQFAHEQGVWHRDIKPENLLLKSGDDTAIMVTDFGMSRILENDTMLMTTILVSAVMLLLSIFYVALSGQSWFDPLFLGIDTHALSAPACSSALEVLAANGVAQALGQMRPEDRFRLVTFNNSANAILPWTTATAENARRLIGAVLVPGP